MTFTEKQIDAGGEALRQFEQAGKNLNFWATLPNSTKRKWRDKALIVLNAALSEEKTCKPSGP